MQQHFAGHLPHMMQQHFAGHLSHMMQQHFVAQNPASNAATFC
jgi:hypothetical protein